MQYRIAHRDDQGLIPTRIGLECQGKTARPAQDVSRGPSP